MLSHLVDTATHCVTKLQDNFQVIHKLQVKQSALCTRMLCYYCVDPVVDFLAVRDGTDTCVPACRSFYLTLSSLLNLFIKYQRVFCNSQKCEYGDC